MGRKGWGGMPPADDDEARKRIVDAALRCIAIHGPAATTAALVSEELSITRRTLYRYFVSTQEMLTAAAEVALIGFMGQIEARMQVADVTEHVIEIVASVIERLPDEPLLAVLLANDPANLFSRQMLRRDVIARSRRVLQNAGIDWAAAGYDEQQLDELTEFLLRIVQSMVVAPGDPPKTGDVLRDYLRRWIGPALDPRRAS